MSRSSALRIPVVMLHSVVGPRSDRPAVFPIWCPPQMFEGYLQYLERKGYTTITLQQLYDHLAQGAELPPKPIALTFDDGYLDNWVYAAPLLAKYGMCGTVFVPTDFIQPGTEARPTIEDVWNGRLREQDLEPFGYLNEAEIRALADGGRLDVQSHGKTHTWLPVSEEVIDFHNPGLRMRHLRWMWWNTNVDRKPYWFEEIDHQGVAWGAPVYRNKLALSSPAVTPDPRLERRLVHHVAEAGGERFFERESWRQELQAEVDAHRREHPLEAQPENDERFRARLREELVGSREILERLTGKNVRFMCWPNGGTCSEALDLLDECGYLSATYPSGQKLTRNSRGTPKNRIGRISATSFFRGTQRVFPWVASFALKVERNRGNWLADIPIKAIWLYRRFVRPGGSDPYGAGE